MQSKKARTETRRKRPSPGLGLGIQDNGPDAAFLLTQIRELETQLDRLIDEAARGRPADEDLDDDDASEAADAYDDLEATRIFQPPPQADDPDGMQATREIPVVATQEVQAVQAVSGSPAFESVPPHRARSLVAIDELGFDPVFEEKARAVLEFLYTRWFRVETTGIDNVPASGGCLLVANHSGTLPLDAVMIKTAVKLEHATPRDVRWLTEDFVQHLPFLGPALGRLGAVRATHENAMRLLEDEQLCAAFPEGVKGIGKLFAERYRLQRFARAGFIKLALSQGAPIVPVAVIGAEETNPLLFKVESLAKALRLPFLPVTPTFPALGPLGLLPAPTKWRIEFGEPIHVGSGASDDDALVDDLAEQVRATIQGMLDRALRARKSVFFG